MKIKKICFVLALILTLGFSVNVLAASAPQVEQPPASVDANTYILKVTTQPGAKVTVLGGPVNIAPVTDTDNDGKVEVTVALAQEAKNVYSVYANYGGETSPATVVTIYEAEKKAVDRGDTTPPEAPKMDLIPELLNVTRYELTGSSEADANIYIRHPDGTKATTTKANSKGLFHAYVTLEPGKTNRFNISAEDAAYNEGPAVQVAIAVTADAEVIEPSESEKEPIITFKAKVREGMPFKDAEAHWSKDYVQDLYERDIIGGKSEDRFDPNGNITRAELTKIAVNAFGYELEPVDGKPFVDVAEDAWYAPYITTAKYYRIVEGYTDGFRPNALINRAAALKILINAAKFPTTEGEVNFKDVNNEEWFIPYISFALKYDIAGGYSDNTFRPGASITRAEVAKIVYKLLQLK